ncbi:hypothetical protein [Streptomyces sp. AA0539]|uniref:hypothetical protein n=1 Tax=Streptomyces sp. AA0539 TaxID=1210045 RepID=UPI00031A4CEA|nr:hypothetical protein [Streptomyces sp. AA0539]
MPTYQQLTSLDFAQLNQAVEDWNTTAQRMTELGEESSDGMLAKTRAANWFGMNATASGERIEQAALAFTYAGSQASGIYGVLRDFRDRQKDCQQRLRELSEEAWGKGLSVTPDGQVVARGGNAYTDDNGNQQYRLTDEEVERLYRQGDYSQFQPPELQAEINSIKARIQAVLEESDEFDKAASRALLELAGDDGAPFAMSAYSTLESAERRQGFEDAEEALAIIDKGPTATDDELAHLNELLDSQQNNEYFATHLMSQLPPNKLLLFLGDIYDAEGTGPDDHRAAIIGDMGENLGFVLGLASQSGHAGTDTIQPDMVAAWEDDMVALGGQRVILSDGRQGPYGFQLMSNIMGSGEYSTHYLTNYHEALVSWEQEMSPPGSAWNRTAALYTPITGDAFRLDPMTGLMEATARSPEAAATIFSNDEASEYLLTGRPLEGLPPELGEGGGRAASEAIGNAFLAATTGMNPYDPGALPVEHEDVHRRNLDRGLAITAEAGDDLQPEFREPMAKVFLNHGEEYVQTSGGLDERERPLHKEHLFEVTRQLSRDPDAYALLNSGINAALVESFHHTETFDGEPIDPGDTLSRAGMAVGFLEQARYEALHGELATEESRAVWDARMQYHGWGGIVGQTPYAGDIFQRGVDVWSQKWLDDELERINDGYSLDSKKVSEIRDRQLVALAEEWYEIHPDWAESSESHNTRFGRVGEIHASANLGNNRNS